MTLARLSLFLILLPLVACGSGESPTAPVEDPIEPIFDVSYTRNTVLLEDGDVVVDQPDAGTVRLDGSFFTEAPRPGQVILVAGEHMWVVESVTEVIDDIEVEVRTATLTEVVEDGTIAWSETPTFEESSGFRWDGGDLQSLELGKAPGDTLMFELTRDGVQHVVQIVPVAQGGELTSATFIFQMTKSTGNDVDIVMKAEGSFSLPEQETQIVIEDGEVTDVVSGNRDIQVDLTLTMSAAAAAGGDHSVTLPGAALEFPIRFLPGPGGVLIPNPIPMSIGIGIQFVTQISMPSAESSAQAQASLRISSDTGFEYHGLTVDSTGKINDQEIRDGSFDSAATFGIPVDVQFGFAFPRVSLNIVGQEFAWVHTGFTAGSSLTWGPVCKSAYAKMVVEGGYDFGFVGLAQIGVKETFAEREQRIDCGS